MIKKKMKVTKICFSYCTTEDEVKYLFVNVYNKKVTEKIANKLAEAATPEGTFFIRVTGIYESQEVYGIELEEFLKNAKLLEREDEENV